MTGATCGAGETTLTEYLNSLPVFYNGYILSCHYLLSSQLLISCYFLGNESSFVLLIVSL